MIIPCPPSPPSTFCQEKVVTSSFGQGKSMANAAEVASQIVRPVRSSAIQSAFGTDPGGRAVPGEDDIMVLIRLELRSGSAP